MKIIKYKVGEISSKIVEKAANVLKRGGVILYPTETTYGLGADALNTEAIKKIYLVKGRDYRKPLSVMVNGVAMAEKYVEVNEPARRLFSTLLPGPLTLVLRKNENVPDILTGGLPTLGLRWPDYPLVQGILESFGFPFTATSANPSGDAPLYDVSNLVNDFNPDSLSLIDLVIDVGPLPHQLPSTVLDLSVDPPKNIKGRASFY